MSFAYDKSSVLEDINIDILQDRFTVILGRNGSGKSTLLKIIAGLVTHTNGTVKIENKELYKLSNTERARLIGFLPQFHKPVFPFTVTDVVLTGRSGFSSLLPSEQDKQIALNAIERIEIMHLKDRAYTELSGGEQQLVMIARVLAQNPKIILLDEPTTHLDLFFQTHVLKILKSLTQEGFTIVAVMHDPNMAFLFGDDFLFVKEKHIITPEDTEHPWNDQFLSRVYQMPLKSVPTVNRALIIPNLNNTNTTSFR